MVVWSVLLLTVFVVSHSFADNFNNKKCQPGVTFHGDTADKILELLSNSGGSKQNRKSNNSNEKPEKNKGSCSVKRPSDCGDLEKSTCKSGIYKIYPEKTSTFDVFCEMEKHGGGWTVFQRRMNGKINFFRKWESYKTGFGNLNGEHWLGNEHLHKLTSHGKIVVEKSEKLRLYSGVGKRLFSSSEESDADVPDVNNNDVEFVPDIFENIKPQKIGGPSLMVEIDEAKFGKRKYNRGRVVDRNWVLGGICRETKEMFLMKVEREIKIL
ncbi:unnamed protein product [Mytilus edulis]|uniref:Fibrinogen C-terminal domain-containing protein n=1 Tax=Mytilus edulis TaxID=6550 RepID=A0A8S3V719_MYTED|nr:unnamed protein product [Mytilus edulis]